MQQAGIVPFNSLLLSSWKGWSHQGLMVVFPSQLKDSTAWEGQECERQAAFCWSWFVSVLRFCCILRLLRNEGVPSLRLCASLSCVQFRRSSGGRALHFEREFGHGWKEWFTTFFSGELVGRKHQHWPWCLLFFVSESEWHW